MKPLSHSVGKKYAKEWEVPDGRGREGSLAGRRGRWGITSAQLSRRTPALSGPMSGVDRFDSRRWVVQRVSPAVARARILVRVAPGCAGGSRWYRQFVGRVASGPVANFDTE